MSFHYTKLKPLINIETFKTTYLQGVDLRDNNGNEVPDDVISEYLDIAMDYIEFEINCPIMPKQVVHYEDYDYAQYRQYVFMQLPVYPIVHDSVVAIRLNFSKNIGIDFPQSWFKVYEVAGQLSLLPNVSTLSSVLIAQAGQLLPRAIHADKAPQLLKVVYKAGIADLNDKIPPTVNHAIGLCAAIYFLQMIGDIGPLGNAGLTSESLSFDGMSETISTANSAVSNLYGATIEAYKKQLEKVYLPLLKRRFKRLHLEFI